MIQEMVRLPWVQLGSKYIAHTLWGTVVLKPTLEPWTSNLKLAFAFTIPRRGYGIYLKGKRIGWTLEAADAACAAAGLITARANDILTRRPRK